MKQVPAVRQLPEDVGVFVISQAYGAARRSCSLLLELGFRVEDLRVAHQRGLIDPELYVGHRHLVHRPNWPPLRWRLRRCIGSGAEVGCQSDGGDEEKDADGDADAVAKAADPA